MRLYIYIYRRYLILTLDEIIDIVHFFTRNYCWYFFDKPFPFSRLYYYYYYSTIGWRCLLQSNKYRWFTLIWILFASVGKISIPAHSIIMIISIAIATVLYSLRKHWYFDDFHKLRTCIYCAFSGLTVAEGSRFFEILV